MAVAVGSRQGGKGARGQGGAGGTGGTIGMERFNKRPTREATASMAPLTCATSDGVAATQCGTAHGVAMRCDRPRQAVHYSTVRPPTVLGSPLAARRRPARSEAVGAPAAPASACEAARRGGAAEHRLRDYGQSSPQGISQNRQQTAAHTSSSWRRARRRPRLRRAVVEQMHVGRLQRLQRTRMRATVNRVCRSSLRPTGELSVC